MHKRNIQLQITQAHKHLKQLSDIRNMLCCGWAICGSTNMVQYVHPQMYIEKFWFARTTKLPRE